jgi:putative colanic acid biosynthesis acetyltransferase WcaF
MSDAKSRCVVKRQAHRYASPWSMATKLAVGIWSVVWLLLYRPTPKHMYRWRLLLLRLFGCKIEGRPYVAPSSRVKMPWLLSLCDRACIGPFAEIYNLGGALLESGATVSQYAYLCGGTHDFDDPELPLVVGEIRLGRNAFVGARALILPGVHVGDDTIIGAGAVVAKDIPARSVCVGNPAIIRPRTSRKSR